MALQNILPDSYNPIDSLGQNTLGGFGPGFSKVNLESNQTTITNRSNSGITFRTVNRYHQWKISISYNTMTKDVFNSVYNFLLEKQATLEPFYVELPQYGNSTAGSKSINTTIQAGTNRLILENNTGISVGDLFYVTNPSDDTHLKSYKVTRLGSSNDIFISPGLQRTINSSDGASVAFGKPLVRVIMSDDNVTYSLNSDNLYTLSLSLEECLS